MAPIETIEEENAFGFLINRKLIPLEPGDTSRRDAAWRRWLNLSPEEKAKENEELSRLAEFFGSGGP